MEINPRKISAEKLKQLAINIEKFNVVEIPAINTDGHLLTYHQRLKALLMLGRGEEFIDVRVPNRPLTDTEVKEYNLIANTHAGEFDMELFNEHFADVQLEEIGIEMADLDIDVALEEYQEELKAEKKAAMLEAKDDEFEMPEDVQTDIVLGDLFEIGPHRLLCGSSTETDNWQKLCGEEKVDLIITDPPYNVDYVGKTKDALKIKNDKMKGDKFYQFLYDFFTAVFTQIKKGGAYYVFHADSEWHNFRQSFVDSGAKLAQCLVWVKNTMVMGRQDYHWQHEPILYGWREGEAHNWYSDRTQTTVLHFARPQRNAEHPTMKPIPLISYLMCNSSKPGDLVADGFLGSGTTMATSHQNGRKCYGLEIDPKYCQVIIDRMLKLDPTLVIKRNGIEWKP